jgi:hypothetical protein
MAWVFATVVLLLMVYVPRFRLFMAWALGVLILIGIGFWAYNSWSENRSRKLIGSSEVAFEELRLRHSQSGWSLSGRVKNNSRIHTLIGLTIDVTLKDCIGPLPGASTDNLGEELSRTVRELLGEAPTASTGSARCDVVGQEEVTIAHLEVPAGQVRTIAESIYFPSGTSVRNTIAWSYRLSSLRGR